LESKLWLTAQAVPVKRKQSHRPSSRLILAHLLRQTGIDAYSEQALARVWKSERFSWQLTMLMHRFPDNGRFQRRMQVAKLNYIASSEAARKSIAENYVGLPF